MLSYSIKIKLAKALTDDKEFPKQLDRIIYNVARYVVEPEYKRQAPVNKGDLRKYVGTKKQSMFNYVVTTTATSRGFPYPVAVHEGTGKYKGSVFDFGLDPSADPGFTRNARYTEEELILFKVLAKRGVEMSIKPNKFAIRTKKESIKEVNNYILKQLDKYLKS